MSQYHVDQVQTVIDAVRKSEYPARLKINGPEYNDTKFMDVTIDQLIAIREVLRGAE